MWGPYVVEKPVYGRRGAFTNIRRTEGIRYVPAEQRPEDHLARRGGMMIQKFVYTGPWPVSYRIMTYFGEPLYCVRYEGPHVRRPVAAADDFRAGGAPIVASARGCTASMVAEPDVLDLAARVHALFPDAPSLGVDILREAESGALYVSEANSGRTGWIIGHDPINVEFRRALHLEGLGEQFGVVDILTRKSIEIGRRSAR